MDRFDDHDIDEYEIERAPEPGEPGPPARSKWPILVLVLLVAIAVAAAFLLLRRPAEQPEVVATDTTGQPADPLPRQPLGPPVEAEELPALDLTDPLVRDLLGQLSSRPEVAAWLAGDGLIRNFVVSLDNVATGHTPAGHLKPLAPREPFRADTRGRTIVVDARSYARYNGLAETVASLDPHGLARLYATLKPRLQDAYRELGHPEGDVDAAVERALVRLLQTPVIAPDPELKEGVLSYRFEDERLEALTPAQKQLLRMGPSNVRLVQDALRELAAALGIPDARLPRPTE
jgi:hypothetical protein